MQATNDIFDKLVEVKNEAIRSLEEMMKKASGEQEAHWGTEKHATTGEKIRSLIDEVGATLDQNRNDLLREKQNMVTAV